MADFLNKAQLGVSSIPPQRVKDLGSDLMGLFGATDKALQTYNTIGANAAKLEYQQNSIDVTTKLGDIRTRLVDAKLRNDTEAIGNINNEVDTVTAELASNADKFKNHQAAYDAYSALANDFAATTRATYKPIVAEAYIGSVRYNQKMTNAIQRETRVTSGIPTTDAETDMKAALDIANGVDPASTANEDFKSNNSMFNADITKNLTFMTSHYKLLSVDADTKEKTYSYEAESKMVQAVYGGRYFVDENGLVASNSKFATAAEMDTVANSLAGIRKALTAEDGKAGSAKFDAVMKEVEKELNAKKTNAGGSDKFINTALNFDKTTLSKSQLHRQEVLVYEQMIAYSQAEIVTNDAKALIASGDATTIAIARERGTGNNDGATISKELDKIGNNIDSITTKAFFEDDKHLIEKIQDSRQYMQLLGRPQPKAVAMAEDIVTGKTPPLNVTQWKASMAIVKDGIENGVGIGGNMFSSNTEAEFKKRQIEINQGLISAYESKLKSDGLNPKEIEKQTLSYVNGLNSRGAEDMTLLIKTNSIPVATVDLSKTDGWFNLGSAVQLTQSQRNYIAISAANSGIALVTHEDTIDYIKNNLTRVSEFWGTAQYVPAMVDDRGFEAIQADALNTLGYELNDITKAYRINIVPSYGKDGVSVWGSVTVIPTDGRPKSLPQMINLSELTKLKVDHVYRSITAADTTTTNITDTTSDFVMPNNETKGE